LAFQNSTMSLVRSDEFHGPESAVLLNPKVRTKPHPQSVDWSPHPLTLFKFRFNSIIFLLSTSRSHNWHLPVRFSDQNIAWDSHLLHLPPNVVVEWLTPLICIREVPGWNLGPESGYPDRVFSWQCYPEDGNCYVRRNAEQIPLFNGAHTRKPTFPVLTVNSPALFVRPIARTETSLPARTNVSSFYCQQFMYCAII
jgi:hypothetical protein